MHNHYAMPNAQQSAEERRFKYGICKMIGIPPELARRLRDWNWHPLAGHCSHHLHFEGKDAEAVKALCQEGYEMFKPKKEATR